MRVLFFTVLALGLLAARAEARPQAPLLHLDLAATDPSMPVRCNADGCDATAGEDRVCRVTLRLCIRPRARAGVTRLRVLGTGPIAEHVEAGLAALPGATARSRGVRFRPPLASGCRDVTRLDLAYGAATQIAVAGRVAAGRTTRARLAAGCDALAPPPPPPPPPCETPPCPPPPAEPLPLRFVRELIDAEGGGQLLSDVGAGDLDGDGLPDVVVSGFLRLLWYHAPEWTPHTIAEGGFGRGGKTLVRDMDGDGRLDVVTGALDPALAMIWFRNTPAGWERHLLTDAAYCHDLVFGDIDGDARADGLCLDQQHDVVLWLSPPADPLAPWMPHTIDLDENAMGSAIADIDRDGRADVVVGRAWYRNAGDGTWTRYEYTDVTVVGYDGFRDYAKVSVLDLDGDGRLDIFATLYAETPAGQVYAFLAPPDPTAVPWTPTLVDAGPLFGVHSQGAAPFDGTTRPQIMVGETNIGGFDFGIAPDPHIYIYRLLGPPADPASWERAVVDALGTHEALVVDLDRDGFPDLIGHEENTDVIGRNGAVYAWRNVTGR